MFLANICSMTDAAAVCWIQMGWTLWLNKLKQQWSCNYWGDGCTCCFFRFVVPMSCQCFTSDPRANYRNSLLYACCCANANWFRHEITLYIKFVSMNWQILAWYGSTACPIRLQSLYVDLFQTMFPRKLVYVFGFVWFVSHLHIGSVYGTFPSPSFLIQSNVGWLESCAAFPRVDNMILSIQYAVVWCSSCFREFPSQ